MKNVVNTNLCCGCHACASSCPKGAITMLETDKGFLYPIIDQNKCIDCGLCKNVCPILNKNVDDKKLVTAYACYNKNLDERLLCSSGGLFILLAKEIIKRSGVVFGAEFNDNFEVIHSYCESNKGLIDFVGAKYTQSSIGNMFKKVKEFLDDGRYVLFTGTPCQVEGLRSFLKKDYEKLYTQDIICHGVPSPKLWRKYLEYQKNTYGGKIKNVFFRNKDIGWKFFQTKIVFDNNIYKKMHKDDLFMRAFLSNICLRSSCYNCRFKSKYRNSDITLADFWGVDKIHPGFSDDKGVSLVVINSKKGYELFDSIKNEIVYKQTNLDEAIKYNISMIKSPNHCKNENLLFNRIDDYNFKKLISKYVPKKSIIRMITSFTKKNLQKITKK